MCTHLFFPAEEKITQPANDTFELLSRFITHNVTENDCLDYK